MAKMRLSISNDDAGEIDRLQLKLDRFIEQLGGVYDDKA
jgi:hypothetical protein